MNRTIKFRGLQKKTKDWVYGYYFYSQREDKHYISGDSIDYGFQSIEVDPATVGQYTGLKDKNGVEIYEGDVVYCGFPAVVSFGWGDDNEMYMQSYGVLFGSSIVGPDPDSMKDVEVTGNIHEHPELLEGGKV